MELRLAKNQRLTKRAKNLALVALEMINNLQHNLFFVGQPELQQFAASVSGGIARYLSDSEKHEIVFWTQRPQKVGGTDKVRSGGSPRFITNLLLETLSQTGDGASLLSRVYVNDPDRARNPDARIILPDDWMYSGESLGLSAMDLMQSCSTAEQVSDVILRTRSLLVVAGKKQLEEQERDGIVFADSASNKKLLSQVPIPHITACYETPAISFSDRARRIIDRHHEEASDYFDFPVVDDADYGYMTGIHGSGDYGFIQPIDTVISAVAACRQELRQKRPAPAAPLLYDLTPKYHSALAGRSPEATDFTLFDEVAAKTSES